MSHFKRMCRLCGTVLVLAQCRCPSPHKRIDWVNGCMFCRPAEAEPATVGNLAPGVVTFMPEGTDFTQSFDGMDWARAFAKAAHERPAMATDEGTLVGWFANAIMRGHDEHAKRVLPIIREWVDAEDKLTTLLALSHVNASQELVDAAHVAARRARMRVRALVL